MQTWDRCCQWHGLEQISPPTPFHPKATQLNLIQLIRTHCSLRSVMYRGLNRTSHLTTTTKSYVTSPFGTYENALLGGSGTEPRTPHEEKGSFRYQSYKESSLDVLIDSGNKMVVCCKSLRDMCRRQDTLFVLARASAMAIVFLI